MKYLEIIYNPATFKILSTKIHGKLDTVIPQGYLLKCIPYSKGLRKEISSKLFNGSVLINNPDYTPEPKSDINKLINYAKKQKWI